MNLTIHAKVLADQLVAKAANRDPEGAGWMVRTTMHGETFPQVSSDVGVAADTIRKRVARLLDWLREHAGVVSLLVFCALAAAVSLLRAKPESGLDTARSAAPQSLTPRQTAALKRDAAFAACDAADWTRCAALLDEAASLDPVGENDARVRNARAAIAGATRPPPTPKKSAVPLKPPL